jgi:integrase
MVTEALRLHRKEQWEHCLKLGAQRFDLVFSTHDGKLMDPHRFSKAFAREVRAAKLPHVTFHGLRHTHITHLLKSSVPVHVVYRTGRPCEPNGDAQRLRAPSDRPAGTGSELFDAALRSALGSGTNSVPFKGGTD